MLKSVGIVIFYKFLIVLYKISLLDNFFLVVAWSENSTAAFGLAVSLIFLYNYKKLNYI